MTQYYTKEKLGENNTRIQPYMTESAYSQELSSQNDAMNQVYKDYILDYHFEKLISLSIRLRIKPLPWSLIM